MQFSRLPYCILDFMDKCATCHRTKSCASDRVKISPIKLEVLKLHAPRSVMSHDFNC